MLNHLRQIRLKVLQKSNSKEIQTAEATGDSIYHKVEYAVAES